MSSNQAPKNNTEDALYNSKIINIYLEYLRDRRPNLDIDSLLEYSGMTRYEVEDHGHWFSQEQVDRFYEFLVEKTGNQNIAREAGRYSSDSQASGALRQYALGFITPSSAYRMLEKQASNMSRGFTLKTRRVTSEKVEVTVTPKPGVNEKPYQCENRIGTFESIAKLFTKRLANVEHNSCFHKGDDSCVYVISWGRTSSLSWRRLRNYSLVLGTLSSAIFFFIIPTMPWVLSLSLWAILTISFWIGAEHFKIRELTETIETQGDAAKDLLDEMNIRHENALLIHEIGQATSTILDTESLIQTVSNVMEKRLDFDRGMIMLSDEKKTRLIYTAGYGYSEDKEQLLKGTEFHLDNPDSKGIAVQAFRQQKPFLVNNTAQIEKDLSERSLEFVRQTGAQSFVCVPVVYEKESLGILAVDNVESKRPLTQSDISLLMGVASQTAISIVNAMSFQKLQESEKKYRELVENANSIILRMDLSGNISFFNEFAQRFFGFSEEEILGKNVSETILKDTESTSDSIDGLVKTFEQDPERIVVADNENFLRNGESVRIAWTYKPIFDNDGNFREVLCIGNDITELKRAEEEKKKLETQLQRAQKMEAIGTLAGGIAHDFNNVLQAISSNIQVLMMKIENTDSAQSNLEAVNNAVQRASELTKRLLIFGRKVESKLRPVDLREEILQVSRMLERTIPKMIRIELKLDEGTKIIDGDSVQIEQILMNLAINARDAMPDGGTLVFETKNVTFDDEYYETHFGPAPGEYVQLSISDTGHGMDKYVQEHMFEPFFTTKETAKGTGLGLAIVYGIIKSHSGYLACESNPGKGTEFKILFPVINKNAEISKPEDSGSLISGGSETILIVDDEESILKPAVEILESFGYRVLTARDGEHALTIFKEKKNDIDLIVLDLIMPGMGGRRCLEELLGITPRLKVVIASGDPVTGEAKELLEKKAKSFLSKPYEMKKMVKVIREVLEGD